jgi:hypothetical protein
MRADLLLLIAAIVMASSASDGHAVTIDDYSQGAISLVRGTTSINENQSGLAPAHVVGGGRQMIVGSGGGSAGQSIVVDTSARTMTLSSGPSSLGYFTVEYGSASSPLGADLAANGETHLQVLFKKTGISGPSAAQLPTISVSSPTGSGLLMFGPSLPIGEDRYLARAAFSDTPSVDFGNLSRLGFQLVRYPQNATLTLYGIESVQIPEPTMAGLGAVGFFLLSAAGRRR